MTTIMVVDDMPVFREPIAACLQANGFEVQCASNGKEALDLIRGKLPDLLLLDIGMPVMDGMALLEILVADPKTKNLPVILLTAIAEKDHVVRAAKLGIRDYMLKSQFSLKELLSRIAARLPAGSDPATMPADYSGQKPKASEQSPSRGTNRMATGAKAGAAAPPQSPRLKANAGTAPRAAVPGSGLAGLQRVITSAELEKKLRNCEEIGAVSAAVQTTLKLISSAGCSIEDVARSIKQDQGLAPTLLAHELVAGQENGVI